MKYGAVILAAGSGTRFKGKKQDIIFHGKEIWKHTYDTVISIIDRDNVVVVGKDFEGGKTRTESVIKGLKALPKDIDKLIILDAARPLVTKKQIKQLLHNEHVSISFVRPLVNTVVFKEGKYINREDLYELLVPQAFDYKLLCKAYDSGRFKDMTDETRVIYDFYGIRPFFIETENNLFKVTYPEDLQILESIYQNQLLETRSNIFEDM